MSGRSTAALAASAVGPLRWCEQLVGGIGTGSGVSSWSAAAARAVSRWRRWQRQRSIGCGGVCGSVSGLSASLGLAAASAVGRLRRRCCCDSRAVVAFWSVVVVVVVAAAAVWSQLSRFFTRASFVVIFL